MSGEHNSPLDERNGIFRFADVEVDERSRTLKVAGTPVTLEARAFNVLLSLLRRPGETLTKDELFALAWPGRIVTDGTLAKAVMKLRSALGDTNQRLIRTVHGFGYRLCVAVERDFGTSTASFVPEAGAIVPQRRNWRLLESLDPSHNALVWLAEHIKTRERRVFKFAHDTQTLIALKREITLYRLLYQTLGEAAPVVPLLDWNLDEPPYFIESAWISGGDLGRWLSGQGDHALDLVQRLDLIAQAAEAVAASHALGVVHKDLKPSNLLVDKHDDQSLRLRLADFGIGALSDTAMIDALHITRLGFTLTQLGDRSSPGTPLYLAPEVIARQGATQRSDIYALGVMLYQAIVGDPRRPLAPGWERDVADPLLREDIAAAADVDPEQRLGDAAELARRLRQLDSRRVERDRSARAAAESARLRARLTMVRQQRRWLAALTGVLLIATAGVGWFAWHAEQARTRASHQAARAEAINRFLNDDILARSNHTLGGDYAKPIGEIVDGAIGRVESAFPDDPDLAGEVYLTLGRAMAYFGRHDEARTVLEHALAAFALTPETSARQALETRLELAYIHSYQVHPGAGIEQTQWILDWIAEHGQHEDLAMPTRAQQLWLSFQDGRVNDCLLGFESWLRDAENADLTTETRADAMGSYARCLSAAGRHQEALVFATQARELRSAVFGRDSPHAQVAAFPIATALRGLNRVDDAEPVLREAHAIFSDRLSPDHAYASLSAQFLGGNLLAQNRPAEAVAWLEQALTARERTVGDLHQLTLFSRIVLTQALAMTGDTQGTDHHLEKFGQAMTRIEQPSSSYLQQVFVVSGALAHHGHCDRLLGSIDRIDPHLSGDEPEWLIDRQRMRYVRARCAVANNDPETARRLLADLPESENGQVATFARTLLERLPSP